MPDIGDRIREVREGKGLSRRAFTAAIGTTEAKVQAIEVGRQRVDHEVLAALSRDLGIDANWLLRGDNDDAASVSGTAKIEKTLDSFVPVAHFTAEASAGHGSLVQDEVHDSTYAYSRAFLERRGLKPDNLAVITVRGDSMSPDLHDKDKILIDCASIDPSQIRDGQIHVVSFGGALYVKRIQRLPQDRLMLASSNPSYTPIIVDAADMGSVRIIGRVVSSSHEW